jgi:hypothetical protein
MELSRRANVLLEQTRTLYVATREARLRRNALLNDYAAMLAAAEAEFTDLQAERDLALERLNGRLVTEGQQPLTFEYFRAMP